MGEVNPVHERGLNRDMALKILASEFSEDHARRRRFLGEARAASALNHPDIITIYEIGENEECGVFLATEFVDRRTLRASINRNIVHFGRF